MEYELIRLRLCPMTMVGRNMMRPVLVFKNTDFNGYVYSKLVEIAVRRKFIA